MAGWELAVVDLPGLERVRAAYRWLSCGGSLCIVVAYSLRGRPRLLVAPPRPSPLCVRGDRIDVMVIEGVIREARAPHIPGFRLVPCRIPRTLLREGLDETLEHLREVGFL